MQTPLVFSPPKVAKDTKIQVLRAVAIIAVVLIHTCKPGYYQVLFRPLVNYGVALFIFLSGYLTHIENHDWRNFYTRRIRRVIIPYIIWTILYTLPSINIKEYIYNLATTQANPSLYYIFVYIQFIILTPLLSRLAKSKYYLLGFIVTPISMLCYKYPIIIFDIQPPYILSILSEINCLDWLTYYYLGFLLGNHIINVSYKLKTLVLWYLALVLLQIFEGYIMFSFDVSNCGSQVKLSCLLTNVVFLLFVYKYIKSSTCVFYNEILEQIGNYSFGIYLIHIFIIECLYSIWPSYGSVPYLVNSLIVMSISSLIVYTGSKICSERISRWIGLV